MARPGMVRQCYRVEDSPPLDRPITDQGVFRSALAWPKQLGLDRPDDRENDSRQRP
jgi:hypothetical protein